MSVKKMSSALAVREALDFLPSETVRIQNTGAATVIAQHATCKAKVLHEDKGVTVLWVFP